MRFGTWEVAGAGVERSGEEYFFGKLIEGSPSVVTQEKEIKVDTEERKDHKMRESLRWVLGDGMALAVDKKRG